MDAAQIIILSGLTLLFLYFSFRLIYRYCEKADKPIDLSFSIVGLIFIYLTVLSVACATFYRLQEIEVKYKNKCPEYKKLENVYQRK